MNMGTGNNYIWNEEEGEKDEGIKADMLRQNGLQLDWWSVDIFILSYLLLLETVTISAPKGEITNSKT